MDKNEESKKPPIHAQLLLGTNEDIIALTSKQVSRKIYDVNNVGKNEGQHRPTFEELYARNFSEESGYYVI